MMRVLSGGAQISFEGYLEALHLGACGTPIPQAESPLLRQGPASPPMDYIILPLEPSNESSIWRALLEGSSFGRDGCLVHVQIARGGRLAFGAYDNFHAECTWAGHAVPVEALETLRLKGVIRSLELYDA
jgi:hypothetical protein